MGTDGNQKCSCRDCPCNYGLYCCPVPIYFQIKHLMILPIIGGSFDNKNDYCYHTYFFLRISITFFKIYTRSLFLDVDLDYHPVPSPSFKKKDIFILVVEFV